MVAKNIQGSVYKCMSLDIIALSKKGGFLESKQISKAMIYMNSCHWNGDIEYEG